MFGTATASDVTVPSTSNVYSNYKPQSINVTQMQPLKVESIAERTARTKLFTREMLQSFYDNNQRDFWVKVMKHFRGTFEISDFYCKKEWTIKQTHPKLSPHSWKLYKWKCFKCHKYSANVELLRSHVEKKHSTDPFRMEYCCFDCSRQYEQLSSLKKHIYMMHRPELRFSWVLSTNTYFSTPLTPLFSHFHCSCDHCGKFYWCMKSLEKHRSSVSAGQNVTGEGGICTDNNASSSSGIRKSQTAQDRSMQMKSNESICGTKNNRFAACQRGKELWFKVMKDFRMTFNITDEECNEDGTID